VSADAVPRLALWRTIAASFAFTFGDRSRFTRLAWPWLAVSVIVGFVTLGTASGRAAMALRVALYIAAFVGFGLAWCRAILSDEDRAWYAPPRLELRALRFLCYALLIAMAMVLPFCALFSLFAWKIVPIMAQWGLQQTLGAALGVLALVLAIGWAFIARLLPALAAIAADVEGDVLAQAWMLGRGQWPRLIAGPLLCAAPFELLQIIFDAIPNAGSFAIVSFNLGAVTLYWHHAIGLALILEFAIYLVELAVVMAFIAFTYHQLATARPVDDPLLLTLVAK